MKRIFIYCQFIYFFSCTPFEHESPEYEFHAVTFDATNAEFFQNGYYLFKIDEYITKVPVGEKKSIHFDYFNGLVCQYEMNRIFNCENDSVSSSSVHIATSTPLADLIKINYLGGLDGFFLARNALLYPDYFTIPLHNTSKTMYLPAKVKSNNRIVLYNDKTIALDTSFFVDQDTIIFHF